MTPKENAEELFNGFFSIIPTPDHDEYVNPLKTHKERAKQCALICVDKILYSKPTLLDNDTIDFFRNTETIRFYKQVKTEIEKL